MVYGEDDYAGGSVDTIDADLVSCFISPVAYSASQGRRSQGRSPNSAHWPVRQGRGRRERRHLAVEMPADLWSGPLALYLDEIENSDRAIAALATLESEGLGHGRPLGATLVKMIDEYALHSGQAHMLRYAALGEIVR